MQVFFIKLILLSKEHVYCCTFRVILTLHEYLHIYYKLSLDKDQPSGSQPGCHSRYSGVTRANTFFNISLKILFSKCHQTLKKIAMRSPLGTANCICLLQRVASLNWLENTGLAHDPYRDGCTLVLNKSESFGILIQSKIFFE